MLRQAGFSGTRVKALPLDPPVVCVLGVKHEDSKDQDRMPGLGHLGETKQTATSSHTGVTEGTRSAVPPQTGKPVGDDRKPPGAATAGPPGSRWLTLAVLCSTVLLINLDITVLNVALPTLVRDLGASSSQLQWVIDAYALVYGGLLLVSGSLADRAGRERLLVAGMLAFAAGSAWAAFSGSAGTLIAARAGMGIGAALMMPPSLSIITAIFADPGERQRAIGVWAGSSGVGFAVGPIISGLLLAHFWWGSVFLINVPIAMAGIVAAILLVPDSKNPAAPAPDLAGGFLSVCGLGLVVWSIIEAPIRGWSSALVAGTGAAGLTVLAGFLAWEHHSSHPTLNLAFFGRRSFSGAVSSLGLLMFALIGALFVLTQFLQFNLGYTPLQAGVRMLPIAAALAAVAPLSAVLVRLAGTKLVTAAGLALVAAGLWQISGASVTWTYADLLPGLILAGIGGALVMPTVSGSVMGSVPGGTPRSRPPPTAPSSRSAELWVWL
jgi:EmrB/QacA subfamily drug resistance transporter